MVLSIGRIYCKCQLESLCCESWPGNSTQCCNKPPLSTQTIVNTVSPPSKVTKPVEQIVAILIPKRLTEQFYWNLLSHLNILEILIHIIASGNAIAFVEVEISAEHVLIEPHLRKCVQEAFVIVISHPPAILDLADHVAHSVPGHTL